MTRREFLSAATLVSAREPPRPGARLVVPVRRVMDRNARCTPEALNRFWWSVWPEAVRSFGRGGIQLQCTDAHGEIRLSPGGRPMFYGLERGVLNLVITDHLPASWDSARALAGMTAWHAGYCVSVIALRYAHGNQLPPHLPEHLRARTAARPDAGCLREPAEVVPGRRTGGARSTGTPPGSGCFTTGRPSGNRAERASSACRQPPRLTFRGD